MNDLMRDACCVKHVIAHQSHAVANGEDGEEKDWGGERLVAKIRSYSIMTCRTFIQSHLKLGL